MSMETRRFLNQSQPQTLQIGVFLLYFDAVFGALALLGGGGIIMLALAVGAGTAGYGIANEWKWAYWLGVGLSVVAVLLYLPALLFGFSFLVSRGVIGFMFAVAQLVALLHPMSQSYQKTWFR